jgi:hypothetical protein
VNGKKDAEKAEETDCERAPVAPARFTIAGDPTIELVVAFTSQW